jgi:hypothetical protein
MRQWLIGKGWRLRKPALPAHLVRLLDDSELPFTDASYLCGHCRDARNFAEETVVAMVYPSDEVAGSTGVAADDQKAALVAAVAKLEADLNAKIKELNLYRSRKRQDAKRVQDRKQAGEERRRREAEEARDRDEVRGRGRPVPPRLSTCSTLWSVAGDPAHDRRGRHAAADPGHPCGDQDGGGRVLQSQGPVHLQPAAEEVPAETVHRLLFEWADLRPQRDRRASLLAVRQSAAQNS